MEIGVYNSWEVLDDKTAVKNTDKSFFKYKGALIPKGVRAYFELDTLNLGDKKNIVLLYGGIHYQASITRENAQPGRTRLFWHTDLAEQFSREIFKGNSGLRFYRITGDLYELTFLHYKVIENDKNDNLESKVMKYSEGRKIEYYVTTYERNKKNREAAIKFHGTRCQACGFDFGEAYGKMGRDFIEVHHVKPLAEPGEEVLVNPQTDLVCLCSNCHRMIHRRKDYVMTLQELRECLNSRNKSME